MLIDTLSAPWHKDRSVNSTDTSFDSIVPTATEPSGDAGTASGSVVHDISGRSNDASVSNSLLLVFFGTGADDTTFDARLIGWTVFGVDVNTLLWIPVTIVQVSCTLSTVVGVAGKVVVATERFVDTISVGIGNEGVSVEKVSPANNTVAHLMADLKGFQKWQLTYDMTGATDGNALWRYL